MIMESPEPSKNNATSSASTINAVAINDSPQVQESPFFRFVNNLSPIKQPAKASHVAQGFVGLNSPPLVFTSPRISCHRETHLLERPSGAQSSSRSESQSDNRGKLIEAPGDSAKSTAELPLAGEFITETVKDFDVKNDATTQHCSPPPSVDKYLVDPVDIDQMYSVNPDEKQSNDTESSLSNLAQSKKSISEVDSKDDPCDKADKPLILLEKVDKAQTGPAYVEGHDQVTGEKNDVLMALHKRMKDDNDCTSQLLPEQNLQDVKDWEDCDEMVSTSHVGAENVSQDASEVTLKHHGLRRRCLQFEEAASNARGSDKSCMKSNAAPIKIKMVKLSEPGTSSLFPQRCSGNSTVTCPKPSGIGLHLNSIVNAMPPGCAATTGIRSSDCLQGKKSALISINKVENMKGRLTSSNIDGQSLIDSGNESQANISSLPVDSFISGSHSPTEPVAICPESLHDKRKLSPTGDGYPEESKQPSPSKKKKRASSNNDDNGCKRCNCKKSKCLKLYCDCFAAGIYCADDCSCQSCLNRPEYENKVIETRKQIESRNPLAFLPKIVPQSTDRPSNNMEDAILMTPSSARHKRGCNCKRSMCQKKYCECYQAGVGCSSGCRCEGCKNVYGTKEDYVARDHVFNKERMGSRIENEPDGAFLNKLEMVASKSDLFHVSPITPSLQCSDQGKEAAKFGLHSGQHLPSSETNVDMLPSSANYNKSLENSQSVLANLETDEMLETASYDWQVDCSDVMDQSSPCDLVANILQDTPLSNPESMSSASLFTSSTKECGNIPLSQSQGRIRLISGSSLRWRGSPNTPRARLGVKHLQSLDSESRLFDIMEDETPDVLKEGLTPTKSVKANSPNQKRVSPPHSRLRGLGSSSSGGFRTGRKFILKSVPSFPPLTPCVESRDNSSEDLGNNAK
ncbi:hypothetical protein HN51_041958 [Arachis hypogaea]|uniref:CRC domain-containing protein n=1 Tax=Arachis hypogaea TaxID=3818 RepID=A0A444YUY5_ARAHY|nr:CRC domain-containing protein [Arachis hypogaea]RYR05716.1 hypothetical protein Ahy_B06g085548 isoform A [Arachis hypogaea]